MRLLIPAELARASLKRIAELKLSPTPDNFERFYREAQPQAPGAPSHAPAVRASESGSQRPVGRAGAGAAAADGLAGVRDGLVDSGLLARLELLVGSAVDTAGGLDDGLTTGGRQLQIGLDQLERDSALAETSVARLLQEIAEATREIREVVRSSQVELISTQRGLATVQAELAESRRLLVQDPLTGSENRRALEAILAREIATARRDGTPLAVAMVDLDHFKTINDRHGHAAGDSALIHLTQSARGLLRGHDAFVRFGGDEFVLILPDTDLRGGAIAGERLQAVLARQPLQHGEHQIAMTLSGGVACLMKDEDGSTLMSRADAALYRAKREGRNRILTG